MKIVVIGSGGREHALCWAIKKSPQCDELWCLPGNAGIADICQCDNIAIDNINELVGFIRTKHIDMVVVGPEITLSLGIVDALKNDDIAVIGPNQAAAQLESSKIFTKNLCKDFDIPTADYATFNDYDAAKQYIQQQKLPMVIKADGLAAGKGVIIANTIQEADDAIKAMLIDNQFANAGQSIVIEEFMNGEELSFFALCDGDNIVPLTSAQDHKKQYDGDKGLNTGGMGAYSPAPLCKTIIEHKIINDIITPTIHGLKQRGINYQGVLYAGLMVNGDDVKLVEYNVRFGDPECQAILMRLKTDIVTIFSAIAAKKLCDIDIAWHDDSAMTIVMANRGYPESYQKNSKILGLDAIKYDDTHYIFHAGTAKNADGDIIATGGRVLNVTTMATSLYDAQQQAYNMIKKIDWQNGFYRKDIGWRAINTSVI